VVLDLQLKDGSGLKVLKAIRQSEAPEHRTLVIVLTNHAFSLYRCSCLEAGADSFLDKAHDYGRLVEILTAAVEGKAIGVD
jgi:DNA-binding response OmpR family regulator